MMRSGILLGISFSTLLFSAHLPAQTAPGAIESPRWTYEIRGGYFYPDLDLFETFYGDDKEGYFSLAGTYRISDRFELGGEYGYLKANGRGILTSTAELGAAVEYRLSPIHLFANFVFQRAAHQRLVPYLGVGLTVATYQQEIELQPSIDGRTDLGYSARIGLRLLLKSYGPNLAMSSSAGSPYWRSFVFLEAQQMSTEVEGIDLGGALYALGFRTEFDLNSRR
jgi:hypothetical protein